MSTNNGKPKLEITELNKPAKFRLLRNEPITGKQTNGDAWQLYPVKDESGNELSFFAPDDIHWVLAEHKLKTGDEFILTRVENGKKGSSKLQVSIIGKAAEPEHALNSTDSCKEIMIQSMRDAAEILAAVPDLGLRAEDARAIGLSLFIART
jgi:hypothetical protein